MFSLKNLARKGLTSLPSSFQVVQSLGVVVFQALDYGLGEEEEQKLTAALEALLSKMTGSDSDDEGDNDGQNEGDADEGIEHDAEDEEMSRSPKVTFDEVIKVSKAVCVCVFSLCGNKFSHRLKTYSLWTIFWSKPSSIRL